MISRNQFRNIIDANFPIFSCVKFPICQPIRCNLATCHSNLSHFTNLTRTETNLDQETNQLAGVINNGLLCAEMRPLAILDGLLKIFKILKKKNHFGANIYVYFFVIDIFSQILYATKNSFDMIKVIARMFPWFSWVDLRLL